ncbi:MAG TPA: RIP metalloprotease RseP [bacterium]|nr:RIP metalloprotease RseP [bacterium]HPT30124.1 RIP metalloprotease RseP [bacterium]
MLLTIIIFLLVLSVLVFVHEFGHFSMARWFGVRVVEFGFGFPPRGIGWQRIKKQGLEKIAESDVVSVKTEETDSGIKETITEEKKEIDVVRTDSSWNVVKGNRELSEEEMERGTVYSLNYVPLGGFVKIKGEDGSDRDDRDSFAGRKIWQRFLMLFAGVFMNIVLAFVLFSLVFMIGSPQSVDEKNQNQAQATEVQIVEVLDNSPAKSAGLQVGDIVLNINGEEVRTEKRIQEIMAAEVNKEVTLDLQRGGQKMEIKVKPEYREDISRGGVGVALTAVGIVRYPWYQAIYEGFKQTFVLLGAIAVAFVDLIGNLVTGHSVGGDVAGPVGIANMTGQVARMGFVYLLQFMALLSLNLAIINILPFPALDGGRILFLIIEKIKGRPVKKELEAAIHNIGFLLLMLLVIWITVKDVWKIFIH